MFSGFAFITNEVCCRVNPPEELVVVEEADEVDECPMPELCKINDSLPSAERGSFVRLRTSTARATQECQCETLFFSWWKIG